ncbi:MAG TPA: TRAP transporter substrate-binding protein [Candidatus Dormibacteraeota bacterium]|nr:TRAP transporter substrate-binding protein [Candidatus Dormibacteraeota bacterium]
MQWSPDSRLPHGCVSRRQLLGMVGAGAIGMLVPSGADAESGAGDVQTLTIRVSHEAPVNFINDVTLKKWASTIQRKSNGKITVQVFPAGQLFNDTDAMQTLVTSQGATLQMVSTSAFYVEPYSIAAGVLELPYEFASQGAFRTAFESPPGKSVLKRLSEGGLVAIGDIIDLGPLIIVSAKRPLRTLADMRGLKVRNLSGRITADAIRALGAGPVDISFPQLPLAMSQGTVDAAVATYLAWNAVLSDIAKYGVDPQMWKVGYLQLVQRDWWSSLTAPTRSLIASTLSEEIRSSWAVLDGMLAHAKQALAQKGRQAYTLTPSEESAWRHATDSVVTVWEPKIGRDIVQGFREMRA